jgi:hypothetical protein
MGPYRFFALDVVTERLFGDNSLAVVRRRSAVADGARGQSYTGEPVTQDSPGRQEKAQSAKGLERPGQARWAARWREFGWVVVSLIFGSDGLDRGR